MNETPKSDKRRKHDAAFRAEAPCLADQSHSTKATTWALNNDPKGLYS
ncbi:hypothetical protein [Hymenobacter psychrophilus]|uniref:Uncharacterized protein n=1 Tax=Hymenobacter psychrophilus TaxID=651662 RepID=A0A1H3L4N5_9BACT|nr:hypothetical protein [Hymenobacter psychrophilus]SDY59300.1 hypothetical protein SAMN04488069_11098 [Hymenobacter psychrophilus]